MLTELRIQNFKSWADTGRMRMAPLTAFFGANSSGKSSILQLLLLKQTVEATDRAEVLHLGDERSYVDLGTFADVIHLPGGSRAIEWALEWADRGLLTNPAGEASAEDRAMRFAARVAESETPSQADRSSTASRTTVRQASSAYSSGCDACRRRKAATKPARMVWGRVGQKAGHGTSVHQ